MSYSDIYTVCYNRLGVFKTKDDAQLFFFECYLMSEGAEHERYGSILTDLKFSNLGKDNISEFCNEINIRQTNEDDTSINVELDTFLSIDDAIKYYEEKVKPILSVSEDYDVDFSKGIPFEYFGSDNDGYTNSSFSEYYKYILEKFDIFPDEIYTSDWSDGKYNLVVNGNEFKLTAWDNLNSVIDNVDSIIKMREKDSEVEL